MAAGIIDTRHRYPWAPADEHFLIAAKRQRFPDKMIAGFLGRTHQAVNMKVKRLEDAGVLLCHREEELDTLERLLAEARMPEVHGEEEE